MFFKSLLKVVTFTIVVGINHTYAQMAGHLGIEGGPTVESFYSFSPNQSGYTPTIGARLGVFWEQEFSPIIALKTGVFGSLKGTNLRTTAIRTGHISIPLLANFTPTKSFKIGIGAELNILAANSLTFVNFSPVTVGMRGEVAWQINPKFRLMAHATVGLLPSHSIGYTDFNGTITTVASYQHITAGISLAYTIKTFRKKE